MLLSYFDNKREGPVVLFIHGTASANGLWEKQYNLLNKSHYHVIGVDLRGHGKTKNPGGDSTTDDHIKDLKETIEHIGIKEPITIVGHSFGAVLGLKYAEKYPDCVGKLVLVSLPARIPRILCRYYDWFLGEPIKFLKKKLNFILKLPLLKRYKFAICSDLNILRQIFKEAVNWDFLTNKPKVTCPVYLSVGRFDYIAIKDVIKKLHHEIPNSALKVFNWAAHSCMEEQPHEFNKWLLTVLGLTGHLGQPSHLGLNYF